MKLVRMQERIERAKLAPGSLKKAVANEEEKLKVERVMADRLMWERVRLQYRFDAYGYETLLPGR